MDKQEYAPSIPHIAHHKEYAEEIVDDFVARQKKEWKQRPSDDLHSARMARLARHGPDEEASLDVIREELIRRTWHPSRVMQCLDFEDEREIFVADIMRTASAKLGAHLQLRAAYKREPISPFKILSIWAFNDGPVGVAVPLASADDYLLSDAVVSRNHESGFGAASPHEDGLRFMVLPSEISIRMLMSMSVDERQIALVASPHMEGVWRQHVFLDLPSSELYFEVDL
eukprot:gene215-biopygen2198